MVVGQQEVPNYDKIHLLCEYHDAEINDLDTTTTSTTSIALLIFITATSAQAEPIDIGSRRELFVDDFLIDTLSGKVSPQLAVNHKSEK